MDPLANTGELENHLQRELDPDVAAQALQLASGAVRAFCKWDLSRVPADTLQAAGNGGVVLTLPTMHLNAITAVRINGITLDLLDPQVSWTKRGQLIRAVGWGRWCTVDVDCDHGYDPIPDLVKLCVLDLAGRQLSNPLGLVSSTVGSVSRSYAGVDTSLSTLHERLLERFSI